mmetsp:Transcript_49223/g.97820  ORF Transcript_49223/g.97820 Transcript_49223/m.97820 type:complete len:93 (-) Transcript_49223:111-389(-)
MVCSIAKYLFNGKLGSGGQLCSLVYIMGLYEAHAFEHCWQVPLSGYCSAYVLRVHLLSVGTLCSEPLFLSSTTGGSPTQARGLVYRGRGREY